MANEVHTDVHPRSNEDVQKARTARQEQRQKVKEDLDKQRKNGVELAQAKIEQESRLRPTPTPDELLAAHAGMNVDIKEPDGSPPQDIYQDPRRIGRAMLAAGASGQPYKTRDLQGMSAADVTRHETQAADRHAEEQRKAKEEADKAEQQRNKKDK